MKKKRSELILGLLSKKLRWDNKGNAIDFRSADVQGEVEKDIAKASLIKR